MGFFSKIRATFRKKQISLNQGGSTEKPSDSSKPEKRYVVNLVGLIGAAVTLILVFAGTRHSGMSRTALDSTLGIPAIIASCILFSALLLVVFIAVVALRKGRTDNGNDYPDDSGKKPADAKPEPKREDKKTGGGFLRYFFGTIGIVLLLGIFGIGASIGIPRFAAWADNADPGLATTNFFKNVPSMKIDETPCKEQADHDLDEATTEFVVKLREECKTLIVTPQNRNNKWRWWEISWVHHLPAPENCVRYQFFGAMGWKGPYCGPEDPPDPGNLPDVKGRMYAEGRGELLFRRIR